MRELLAHQAGLYGFDERVDRAVVADPQRLAAVMARQRPLMPPGECQAYHGITLGFYQSELVRRIGLPVGDEDIMPNKGEPLTKAQQELIRRWVGEGAEWPATGDAHIAKELAALVLPKIVFELPDVDADRQAKIDAAVAELRKRGAVVQQVAQDTKALDVNLSLLRDKAGDAEVALLPALAPVLVWLNVSRYLFTLTSNGMELTPDQANRVLVVRLVRERAEKLTDYYQG